MESGLLFFLHEQHYVKEIPNSISCLSASGDKLFYLTLQLKKGNDN